MTGWLTVLLGVLDSWSAQGVATGERGCSQEKAGKFDALQVGEELVTISMNRGCEEEG